MLIATVRAGNVIGGGDWAEDRLVPDLMRAAFSGEPRRSATRIDPAVAACARRTGRLSDIGARLLAGDAAAAEAWNLGPSPTPASGADICSTRFARRCRSSGRHPRRTTAAAMNPACSSSIRPRRWRRLGWRPRWESEMIERTIAWYRAYHERGRVISSEQLDAYEAALA